MCPECSNRSPGIINVRPPLIRASNKGFPYQEICIARREYFPFEGRANIVRANSRILLNIHTHSVSPVASAPLPAPADHARFFSPSRALVKSSGASAIGTNNGHSDPSAILFPVDKSSAIPRANSAISWPVSVGELLSSRHQPKFRLLIEPTSAAHTTIFVRGMLPILQAPNHLSELRGPCIQWRSVPTALDFFMPDFRALS